MRLSEYIKTNAVSVADFAIQIGAKSRATVYRYINSEDTNDPRIPNADIMQKITLVTEGKVTPNDFYALSKPKSSKRRPSK